MAIGHSYTARGRRWIASSFALVLLVVTGCAGAEFSAGLMFEYPVSFVERPPPGVRLYPYTYYRGYPAYWVDHRWYYSTPRGWVVFREEPRELRYYRERHRLRIEPARPDYVRRPRHLFEQRDRRVYRSRDADDRPVETRRRRIID